jgi:HSP20 family molecular chaperone IbpA
MNKKGMILMYIPSRINFLEDSLLDDYKKSPIMNTDIIESENNFLIQMDLPGIKKEDITIEIENGLLSISANITREPLEDNKKYIRKERFTGKIKRTFEISSTINEDDISASFEDGVLVLSIPKQDADENKKIIKVN